MSIQTGKYQNYKGQNYEVISVAIHSETEEELVVYHPLYGQRALWVQPLEMFTENVLIEGEMTPRFRYVE